MITKQQVDPKAEDSAQTKQQRTGIVGWPCGLVEHKTQRVDPNDDPASQVSEREPENFDIQGSGFIIFWISRFTRFYL